MKPKMEFDTASLVVIGVDIGKEVFHLVGLGVDGKIAFRKKIRRLGLKDAFEKLPPCIVGMEACLSAHFVSRALRALGHQPRIIPAIYVKPFVKGQKNDYNDAEAIAEAALRPNLRFAGRPRKGPRMTARRCAKNVLDETTALPLRYGD
jgi:transposase